MIERFWEAFVAATGVDGPYTAWAFGAHSTPELATELGLLVRDGPKRATASVLAAYEEEGEALPEVGELSVVLDGAGAPLCVIRTAEVAVLPFGEVDAAFAWDEGEGDRTLASWRDAHLRFFARQGVYVDDDTMMVLQRFELLWAPPAG